MQRSRDELRMTLLSQMDSASQQLGTVTLGSVARDLAPNGELALQIEQLNVRAEQLSSSLSSKDVSCYAYADLFKFCKIIRHLKFS